MTQKPRQETACKAEMDGHGKQSEIRNWIRLEAEAAVRLHTAQYDVQPYDLGASLLFPAI